MAKDLNNLIQIHEWEVDEKRRKLGELLRLLDNLEAQAAALEDELVREQVRVFVDLSNDEVNGTYQRVLRVELESDDLRVESVLPESVEVTISEEEVSLTVQGGTAAPTQESILQATPTATAVTVP